MENNEKYMFALSVDWRSIFRLISDEAIRTGVCKREKNIKVRDKPYPQ